MPDSDKVHSKLPRRYQKVYQQICEGHLGYSDLAAEVGRPLVKDIRDYGNEPIKLLCLIAKHFDQIPPEPLLRLVFDWNSLSQRVDVLSRQSKGNKRGRDLVVRCAKQLLREIEHDLVIDDACLALRERYLESVYKARFLELIPLAQHYDGANEADIQNRLEGMQPYVENEISAMALQSARMSDVARLRHPPRNKKSIGLHDDLLRM